MLDVYRSFYGFSGEPFRLGPDYRFSLHHTSYASAKAYLDYAIYQGEGFIAISGGPGTGKTTLISEILATLDRTRVQVATLTSTQLESRDLLHMVASAFGIQAEGLDKAALVIEIEAFLVKKLRGGQRAMLIVDEAQGLSANALEELRLLANLQYQYQLLLQICLVGQEKLLELIHSPGMEHLQQRLVAATTLEPLGYDETIDYIEHRLTKVGWKGDPSIDEGALRLIYRYSGGTPRRINLIANRLFLYGGMERKHQLSVADAQTVIEGLKEEHLLGAQPLIEEQALLLQPRDPNAKPRVLPRPGKVAEAVPRAAVPESVEVATEAATAAQPEQQRVAAGQGGGRRAAPGMRLDSANLPGSRSRPPPGRADEAAMAASARGRGRKRPPPGSARRYPPPSVDPDTLIRPQRTAAEKPSSGSKGYLVVGIFVLAAIAAYFVGGGAQQPANPEGERLPNPPRSEALQPAVPGQGEGASAEGLSPGAETTDPLAGAGGGEKGTIQRNPSQPGQPDQSLAAIEPGPAASGQEPQVQEPQVQEPSSAAGDPPQVGSPATGAADASPERETQAPPQAAPSAAAVAPSGATPAPAAARPAPPSSLQPPSARPADATDSTAPPVGEGGHAVPPPSRTAKPAAPTPAAAPPGEPAAQATPPETRQAAADGPDAAAIAARREQLQQAAQQRFSSQLARARVDSAAAPVASAPAAAPTPAPATAPAPTVAPVAPSQPKTHVAAAKAPPSATAEEVRALLLGGRWNSGNKPASLLPSETTYCKPEGAGISCVSVPQNVKTQYGTALYKVESQLSGFSPEGLFEMSYKTLVKLVGESGSGVGQDWQVSEYAMSCKLEDSDRVACLDGKGITREYRRPPR